MDQVVRSLAVADRDLLVSVHSSQTPSKDEWDTLIQALKEADARKGGDLSRVLMLLVGDGGAPDAAMRDLLNKALHGRQLLMAVVTDSLVARGVVTAIGWFNPRVRVYAAHNGEAAFGHLGLSDEEAKATTDLLVGISRLLTGVSALDLMIGSTRKDARA